jgi:hypothetical protein
MVTPTFMVDKQGSVIGRRAGDYTTVNKVIEDYYHPAPEADSITMNACGKKFHSLLDCVWGFSHIENDEYTSRIPFGVYKAKKLPEVVEQGPSIYQLMQDNALGMEFQPNGEKLCNVFFDDTYVGDSTKEEHIQSLRQVVTAARKSNIQYRLAECIFFQPEVLLIGFVRGGGGRRADAKKTEQLPKRPQYTSCADIETPLASSNYSREFFGPDFSTAIKPFRQHCKKGAEFARYADDEDAHRARQWLVSNTVAKVILVSPDWEAAAHPWISGRPFEAYLDASDEAWCIALCQRESPRGTPRPIATVREGFLEPAT